jgi:hypothetical protein
LASSDEFDIPAWLVFEVDGQQVRLLPVFSGGRETIGINRFTYFLDPDLEDQVTVVTAYFNISGLTKLEWNAANLYRQVYDRDKNCCKISL